MSQEVNDLCSRLVIFQWRLEKARPDADEYVLPSW